MSQITIVVHGGAGTILQKEMTPEKETAYRDGLRAALQAGYTLLSKGKSALDAVCAAVVSLEDNILFNAGKGSVFAKDGSQEMDAAIMDGKTLDAGAVAAVKRVRNPIELARAIMTSSPHVLLHGKGALEFAKSKGLTIEPDAYFFSEFRRKQWEQLRESGKIALDHGVQVKDKKFGTVGAVALDKDGNIAAATSTGGMTNKEFGRIGDSPIIGAGTYANNNSCAISCTGHGEPFIRAVTAYDVSCLMEYKGLSLKDAMHLVVHDKLLKLEGEGGMIGVDAKGNTAMVFNSDGMYRGTKTGPDEEDIAIYK